jgi:hypothetical protein
MLSAVSNPIAVCRRVFAYMVQRIVLLLFVCVCRCVSVIVDTSNLLLSVALPVLILSWYFCRCVMLCRVIQSSCVCCFAVSNLRGGRRT